jgi:dephospho-CoA kinase
VTARNEHRGRFVIGVTGNIACGKTTVMQELARLGAEGIDADRVYHELIGPGEPLWQALVDHFGEVILDEERRIDRRKLGSIVFADPAKLRELEALTHPAIRTEIKRRIDNATADVVAIDAVKLVQSELRHLCDALWVVTCPVEAQRERLLRDRGISQVDVDRRLAAQPDTAGNLAFADTEIDNSGDVEHALRQVREAWSRICG